MRGLIRVALLGLALALALAAPASAALTPTITTYPSSDPVSAESHPFGIAAGPDGAIWFTDPYANRIGRMTVDGQLTLQAPAPAGFEWWITAGSDGAMWFVSQSPSSVSRIDSAGSILTKELVTPFANPTHIVSGPDGAIWFTESAGKVIGRIPASTPLAVPDESRLTADNPNAIAAGPDGNLWFTEYNAGDIGRMAPDGTTTYFPLPAAIDNPEGIAAGPDGALWFTTLNPSTVIRMTTGGEQRTFRLPEELQAPDEIIAGPDNALWFSGGDAIGRMQTDGTVESFALPENVGLYGLAAGPDGNVWFTEINEGQIGRITTPPSVTTVGAVRVEAGRATVAATVNGHAQPTNLSIEYGPGGGEARSPVTPVGAGGTDQTVQVDLTGLTPSTTYRFRASATNPTGTTTGGYAELTTGPPPGCRVTRIRRRAAGKIVLKLRCTNTESIDARATTPRRRGSGKRSAAGRRKRSPLLYGKARVRVVKDRATIRIKPTKRALALLRRRHKLRLKIQLQLHGGGVTTLLEKKGRAKLSK